MSRIGQRTMPCQVCGLPVEQPEGRGRGRERHDECGRVHRALTRLEREIARVEEWRPGHAAELRRDLFDLANRLPRARDARGRFRRLL